VEAVRLEEDLDAAGLKDTSDSGGWDSEEEEEGHEEGEEGHEMGRRGMRTMQGCTMRGWG
jgi:hypothetical protein